MNGGNEGRPGPVKNRTTVERESDREVVVTRMVNGPPRIVFEAFTTPSCSSVGGCPGRWA